MPTKQTFKILVLNLSFRSKTFRHFHFISVLTVLVSLVWAASFWWIITSNATYYSSFGLLIIIYLFFWPSLTSLIIFSDQSNALKYMFDSHSHTFLVSYVSTAPANHSFIHSFIKSINLAHYCLVRLGRFVKEMRF